MLATQAKLLFELGVGLTLKTDAGQLTDKLKNLAANLHKLKTPDEQARADATDQLAKLKTEKAQELEQALKAATNGTPLDAAQLKNLAELNKVLEALGEPLKTRAAQRLELTTNQLTTETNAQELEKALKATENGQTLTADAQKLNSLLNVPA